MVSLLTQYLKMTQERIEQFYLLLGFHLQESTVNVGAKKTSVTGIVNPFAVKGCQRKKHSPVPAK